LFSFPPIPTALVVIPVLCILITEIGRRRSQLQAPRITKAELDTFQARIALASLPIARITLTPDAPIGATASRIGGPAYADTKRRKWPVRGQDRRPMLLIAQINFAEVPPLDGFPGQGLLQLFGRTDERGHLENLEVKADRVIRWFPEPGGSLTLTPPEVLITNSKYASLSPRAVQDGLSFSFEVGLAGASLANWPYDETVSGFQNRLPENDEVGRRLKNFMLDTDQVTYAACANWIGGHPRFVQGDLRAEPRLRKLNRVLLHLTDDGKDIRLGDAGELNLMISGKALRNEDFEHAFCIWDCS
jgi:uncharacterized protein YwqG